MLNNIDLLSSVFSGLRFVFHFSLSLSCMYRCFDIDIWFSCEGPLLATAFNSHGTFPEDIHTDIKETRMVTGSHGS